MGSTKVSWLSGNNNVSTHRLVAYAEAYYAQLANNFWITFWSSAGYRNNFVNTDLFLRESATQLYQRVGITRLVSTADGDNRLSPKRI